jgi:hypothetical protein
MRVIDLATGGAESKELKRVKHFIKATSQSRFIHFAGGAFFYGFRLFAA